MKEIDKIVEGIIDTGQMKLFTSNDYECVKEFFQSKTYGSNKYLKNIFSRIGSNYDENTPFYDKIFSDLCEIIKGGNYNREFLYNKLKKLTGDDFEGDLKEIIKVAKSLSYENSFTKEGVGFRYPTKDEKGKESRVHNLKPGELINSIRDTNLGWEDILSAIKSNISTFIKDEVNLIHKYDIISSMDFGDNIKKGDIIEVKDIRYNDSYLAEPLASPVKMSSDEIRGNQVLLGKYNDIIDGLYKWLNDSDVGLLMVKKMVEGLKGFFIHDNIFVPISEFEFYLSNQGQNSCDKHRRIAIRYHIKKGAATYKLMDGKLVKLSSDDNGITYNKDSYVYCGEYGPEPKIKYSVSENTDPISEFVDKFLDL